MTRKRKPVPYQMVREDADDRTVTPFEDAEAALKGFSDAIQNRPLARIWVQHKPTKVKLAEYERIP